MAEFHSSISQGKPGVVDGGWSDRVTGPWAAGKTAQVIRAVPAAEETNYRVRKARA